MFETMPTRGLLALAVTTAGAVSASIVPRAAALPLRVSGPPPHGAREVWATINRCQPHDQPDTIGVRASMPGDGNTGDVMYMRFRLQYLNSAAHRWSDLGGRADSGFVAVGNGGHAIQSGRTFTLAAASHAVWLRGVVDFQWRRGARVLYAAERLTAGGHTSGGGADPPHYSAATCLFR
jgi:hypothetical protein